jgi:hypothetical protein
VRELASGRDRAVVFLGVVAARLSPRGLVIAQRTNKATSVIRIVRAP